MAQDTAEEVVVVGAADPALGAAQVTSVDPADLPAAADLAAVVDRAPGVVVSRLGATGDLAQVGIRGAGARYSEVLLDGISLNPEGGGAVDLSELPVGALARVDVYRGVAPVALGTTGLGGTLALVPSEAELARVQLAIGAFGTAHGATTAGITAGSGHLLVSVDALHTLGDFPYYDDSGTRLVPGDDRIAARENNDVGQGSAVVRYRGRSWVGVYSGLWREEGVPGSTFAPTDTVRYAVARHVAGLRAEGTVGSTAWWLRGSGSSRVSRLYDPDGEVGAGANDTSDQIDVLGADGQTHVGWSSSLGTVFGAGARVERFLADDRLEPTAPVAEQRAIARGVAGATAQVARWVLTPGAIVLIVTDAGGVRTFALPRIGATRAWGAFELRMNAGLFARPPDLLELYADQGPLKGNPLLRAEHGTQVDAGTRWRGPAGEVELVAFVADYLDQIAWTTGGQGVSTPTNLGHALAVGIEAAGRLEAGPWSASARGTWTEARNLAADPDIDWVLRVPRVPVLDGGVDVRLERRAYAVGLDLTGATRTWGDTANGIAQPARLWLGATGEVRWGALAVELDLRNATGSRAGWVPSDPRAADPARARTAIVDFAGYPLPGRAWTCTVRWQR